MSFIFSSLSSCLLCLILSLSLSLSLPLSPQSLCICLRVLLWWWWLLRCAVVCAVLWCVRCRVWCVTRGKTPCVHSKRLCVHSKRLRVYGHHAHMLKHMCPWCGHARARFEWTHGEEGRRGGGRCQPRVFIGKTCDFLTFVEHLNRMLVSSLIANLLLTKNGPRRVINCPRGSPKETKESYTFKV